MGLVILLPLAISFMIFFWLIELLTSPFLPLAEAVLLHIHFLEKEPHLTLFISRILVIIFLFCATFLTGWLTNKYIFSFFLQKMHIFFLKIPGLGSIYKFSKDLSKAVLNTETSPFQKAVLISFPNKESLALGLVIENVPKEIKTADASIDIAVFVPTAPHPISGFILMAPKKCTAPVDMTTEEVFKFIISCGVISPEDSNPLNPSNSSK